MCCLHLTFIRTNVYYVRKYVCTLLHIQYVLHCILYKLYNALVKYAPISKKAEYSICWFARSLIRYMRTHVDVRTYQKCMCVHSVCKVQLKGNVVLTREISLSKQNHSIKMLLCSHETNTI